jgi:cation diffusion facilitator CzcD-associated flavoprotein CzcO
MLVLAMGLTSIPKLPNFEGSYIFDAPVFHVQDLHTRAPAMLTSAKEVVVYGASKSGFDAAYLFTLNCIQVRFIVRKNGGGLAWMVPALLTSLRLRLENLAATRLLRFFSPCVWGDADEFKDLY